MSRHIQAMSTRLSKRGLLFQYGGHQSAGQPDQAEGTIRGGNPAGGLSPSSKTPWGSPGLTAWSGPTVPGAAVTGSFGFGTMSSGGRIDRFHTASQSTEIRK